MAAEADLEGGFINPPAAARPVVFWWWFNSHVSREGITRDLEQLRAKGIGGVVLINTSTGFGAGPIPKGPAFLSPEWRALYRHALAEADRLGLEVGVNLSTGWCMGGPWIKPENSGRWYLQSSLTVTGPRHFSESLPLPGNRVGYDNARQLLIKDYINLPLAQLDYRDTAIVAYPVPAENTAALGDERLKELPAKANRLDASSHATTQEVMGPVQVPWSTNPGDAPVPARAVVDLTSNVDASGRLEWDVPPGRWVIVRTGHRMTGARTSYALPEAEGLEVDWLNEAGVDAQFEHLGKILLAEAGPLVGRTLKYFHEDSFEDGFPNWTTTFLEKFKRYRGYDPTPYLPVLCGALIESAEVSDRFLYDYRRTVADCMADGHYGRFAELCHQAGVEVQAEGAGPSWSGTMGMDALKNLGRADRPMGEFWQDNYRFVQDGQNQVTKMVATAAHVYGKRRASAEAFTTFAHWSDDPAALKPTADRAFCEGINRIVFHTSTATRPEDGKPGYEYGAGTHFNPNITWWEQAGAFVTYISRCEHLLQAGHFVADVLYYNGDVAPNLVGPKHTPVDLGPGYDYDVCNTEVLLTRLAVKDGRIVLPDGMSYRLLVLPNSPTMPVAVAQRLRELVDAGATVIGPKPQRDPGLRDYPRCDEELRAVADELWTAAPRAERKGRMISSDRSSPMSSSGAVRRPADLPDADIGLHPDGAISTQTARAVLAAAGVAPDFRYGESAGSLDYLHRSTDDAEIYFVVNRNDREDRVPCTFRVAGKQPELWDPVTGAIRPVRNFTSASDGTTTLTVTFAPRQSFFVVFRTVGGAVRPDSDDGHAVTRGVKPTRQAEPAQLLQTLTGSWSVDFDPTWGGPGRLEFPSLTDWIQNRDERIRYYSGTAQYRKSFDLTVPVSGPLWLDLGAVKNVASVTLNGIDLGVVWCAPWRVDISEAVKSRGNDLRIAVVNLWPNRLIGDKYLPATKRLTRTNIPLPDDARLLPSGLLGPVTLQAAAP